jgi:esterase/lipase
MQKILYLHGLDGSLSHEKKEVLERHFEIIAPQLNYRNTPDMFGKLTKLLVSENCNAVIGNSMGGCFAYYLSLYQSVPALCFNPALGHRPIDIYLPELKCNDNPIVFVIGGEDNVVPAIENFTWIRQNANQNFVMKWHNKMGHRVDITTFSIELEAFACHYF